MEPPSPLTGYAHPKCYLPSTNNRSTTISGEHYISKSVLKEMGPTLKLANPWFAPGKTLEMSIANATANILCARHNSALAPLDDIAGKLFRVLKEIRIHTEPQSAKRKGDRWHYFSGETIELWMLKLLCGIYYGKIASKDGEPVHDKSSFDIKKFTAAIQHGILAPNCGMYIRAYPGLKGDFKTSISVATLTSNVDARVIGIRVTLHGLEFEVILDPFHVNFDYVRKEGRLYRPWRLVFSFNDVDDLVVLAWPTAHGGTVHLNITAANSQS